MNQCNGGECCARDVESHDHDHGHSHTLPPKRFDLHEEEECSCCDHSQPSRTHLAGTEAKLIHACSRLPQNDDCGCCGDDRDHSHAAASSHAKEYTKLSKREIKDDPCDCCDHSCSSAAAIATALPINHHDHGHEHRSGGLTRAEIKDDECGCSGHCSTIAGVHTISDHVHGHDHIVGGHDHDHGHSASSCCAHDIETGHSHQPTPHNHQQEATLALTPSAVHAERVCNACDVNSPVLHVVQATRLRIANMCCAGEEKIVRQALADFKGIESISINILGRYAVIKHCPEACCASSAQMVEVLNGYQLGVSIQDVHDGNNDVDLEPLVDYPTAIHAVIVGVVFLIGLGMYLHPSTYKPSRWVFVASTILGILPIVKDAGIALIIRRMIDIHTLIVIAVAGAIAAQEYFDASLLVALFLIAEVLETFIKRKVQRAVNISSASSLPKEVFLKDGRSKKLDDVVIGDILAVRTGEMISADGIVRKGDAVVNEAALTGESTPIEKKINAKVLSGTVVMNGYIEIEVTVNPQESTMRRLAEAVAEVQADRGYYGQLVDSFAQWWTPLVLIACILLVTIGGGVTGRWNEYLHRALVLMVLACPCAIVIAAPIPSVSAIAVCAKQGVLIRGSSVIERMATIDAIAVDKTGTLTKGFFKVTAQLPLTTPNSEFSDLDPLLLAAAVEAKSTHPLAAAIVMAKTGCIAEFALDAENNTVHFPEVRRVKAIDGVGVEAWVESIEENDWKYVCIGNERLLSTHGGKIKLTDAQRTQVQEFNQTYAGCSIVYVTIEDELTFAMALADEIRPETLQVLRDLQHNLRIQATMLTGDQTEVAQMVCREVGITSEHCHSRLLPAEKLHLIQQMQQQDGNKVMMIGDGVNDSTALAAATVGTAMGAGGAAMAVQAADVVLIDDNLLLLPLALRICRMAKSIILENCFFAIGVKVIAIVLATLGLLQFWEAVLVDIGTLLVVVANGMRVMAQKPREGRLEEVYVKKNR